MRNIIGKIEPLIPVGIIRNLRRLKQFSNSFFDRLTLYFFSQTWRQTDEKRAKNDLLNKKNKTPQLSERPMVNIETTDVCNLNCVMCETWLSTRVKGFMSMDDFVSNLNRIQTLGQKSIAFHTIGDPLVDKNLPEQLRLCYEKGIEVDLRTNGILLHRFFNALLKYPPARLRLSIDGATKETYEKIRVNGKFDQLLSNLKELKELFDRHHILCELGVDMVVCDENIHEIPLFYQEFHQFFKLNHMHFNVITSLSGDRGSFFLKEKMAVFSRPVPPCKMPFESLYILHDNKVSVCCRDYHGEIIVGDLTSETIEDVWHGDKINALRQAHLNAESEPEKLPRACRECYASSDFSTMLDIFIHRLIQENIKKFGTHHLPIENIANVIKNYIEESASKFHAEITF